MNDIRSDFVEHAIMVRVPGRYTEPLGGGFGSGGREVTDTDDLDCRHGVQAVQMLTSNLARPDQGGSDHESLLASVGDIREV